MQWRPFLFTTFCLLLAGNLGMAAEEIWFVNKTSTAVDGLHLAKPNSQIWGPNYLEGGGVPEGGRTVLAGVKAGDYDVKLHMKTGGNCIIHKVAIKPGDSFQVSDSDLKECTK